MNKYYEADFIQKIFVESFKRYLIGGSEKDLKLTLFLIVEKILPLIK